VLASCATCWTRRHEGARGNTAHRRQPREPSALKDLGIERSTSLSSKACRLSTLALQELRASCRARHERGTTGRAHATYNGPLWCMWPNCSQLVAVYRLRPMDCRLPKRCGAQHRASTHHASFHPTLVRHVDLGALHAARLLPRGEARGIHACRGGGACAWPFQGWRGS
jgi:hypothetical protein